MYDSSILVVDDDRAQAESLRRVLALEGFAASCVFSHEDAITEMKMRVPDAVVSDYRLGDTTGLDLYLETKELDPDILFIVATGYGSLDTAVKALRAGVHDFLTKPIDTDELVIKLKKALDYRSIADENVELRTRIESLREKVEIIATSAPMMAVLDTARQVADSAATVMIEGESGTGKELIARALHVSSPRAAEAYVKVNCAAIPENLLESELFGHEAGAFTGAIHQRTGKFEVADKGTIFLDEVGEMPLHLQSKFLRVLQEQEFERVGGNQTIEVDVRVIAATNRDLAAMVKDGDFREDLFYRLNVIPLRLPPLRERIDDVLPLASHFLECFCEKNGRRIEGFTDDAVKKLHAYTWPGNVRELENSIERAVVLARGKELSPEDFVFSGEQKGDSISGVLEQIITTDLTLEELERRIILMALERCGGNVSQTARTMGMTRRSLQYRLEKIRSGEDGEANE